ncbi:MULTISPECIES: hypothetical protein [Burkholderia]|uniref:hypothetical protein n=1 Tax=Burkholderia TaxID=32008 RepID=UPI00148E9BAF|nr:MULTISPECIES: hypothetical protein [Burkholderia]MDN7755151.1 hypothetical protein [Burkholderia gladioli]QJW80062.1 hypothetical protein GAS18_15750 [Burkholderia glumae]
MTTVAIWYQENYPTYPIWVCSDSRISGGQSESSAEVEPLPLLRHSPKVFPLLITCMEHTAVPKAIAFQHTIGLAYAGSSLFAVNLYAALTPILANLRGNRGDKVSIRDVAKLAGTFLLEFLRAYGARTGGTAHVEIAIFGFCRADLTRRVFVLSPKTEPSPDGPVASVTLDEIDFTMPEQVFLMGSHKAEILERIRLMRSSRPADSSFRQLAPRDVIREVIKEGRFPDIGGTVQLAQAHIDGFLQFMDLERPAEDGAATNFRYLGFDLNEFGNVGPCWFSLPAVM